MHPLRLALVLIAVLGAALVAAPTARAEPAGAQVTVVHGVPGLTVDVYVNGDLALPGFEPGTITAPLPFAAGRYDVAIAPQGAGIAAAVITGSAAVADGDVVSLVAHLAADGTPSLGVFVDDLSLGRPGEGRLIVRHAAAAPAVDARLALRLWRWRLPVGTLADLTSGTQAQVDVPAGRYEASLVAADTSTRAFGPAAVRIHRDRATLVYAVGSLADGSFRLLVSERTLRDTSAKVTVVHGVPGLTVDVYVDGELAIPGFEPRTITAPIDLPCGEHDLAIVPSGADLGEAVLTARVDLAAGSDQAVVAHLAADGTPVLSVFANDLERNGWRSRVVVRHTAAAPRVDVPLVRRAGWRWRAAGALEDIGSGEQKSADVRAGWYAASVTPGGIPDVRVLGPAHLALLGRTVTFVYAIGSLADGSLDLLTQTRRLR